MVRYSEVLHHPAGHSRYSLAAGDSGPSLGWDAEEEHAGGLNQGGRVGFCSWSINAPDDKPRCVVRRMWIKGRGWVEMIYYKEFYDDKDSYCFLPQKEI